MEKATTKVLIKTQSQSNRNIKIFLIAFGLLLKAFKHKT